MADPWIMLPQPQEIRWTDGSYDLGREQQMLVDRRAWDRLWTALEDTRRSWELLGVSVRVQAQAPRSDDAPMSIVVGSPEGQTANLDSPEGYQLEVTPRGLRIVALTDHGLFNGLQTLSQLVTQSKGRVPGVTVRDWPALAVRGIHLDLKGCMAPAAYWQEAIRLLSSFKINVVLAEYEDKFPYSSHPDVVDQGALTPDDLKAILATARDHFVEVIPLLQCLGHVEYILRRPRYADLRESGNLTQFCPEQEGSLRLFRELADEIIAAHPDSHRFHLGADEARLLGDCPRCQTAVEDVGRLGLYLRHVGGAAAHLRERGLRAIIWDDMVQRNLGADGLNALPEDVILCDWAYRPQSVRAASFYYGGEARSRYQWASRRWLDRDPSVLSGDVHWLEEAPAHVHAFAQRYWDRGEYPDYGSSLPWVRFFVDRGRTVIGASAAKGADGFNAFSPTFANRIGNVATWAVAAKEDGAEGVISTAWSRYSGLNVPCEPFELGWYTYIASAAFYWEEREPDRRRFDEQFASCFLGNRESPAPRAIDWLDRGKERGHAFLLESAAQALSASESATTPFGRCHLRHLALAARLGRVQGAVERDLGAGWAHRAHADGGLLAIHRHRALVESTEARLAELAQWRALAHDVLTESLNEADAREVIAIQCDGHERRIALLREYLESVKPFRGGAQ